VGCSRRAADHRSRLLTRAADKCSSQWRCEGVHMSSILVIDDGVLLRRYVRCMLEKEGYEVREAVDGLDGVQAYRQAPADLVICDLFLPLMGGLAAIRELLSLDPAVKVVAISGGGVGSEGGDVETARELGAGATLATPFPHNSPLRP